MSKPFTKPIAKKNARGLADETDHDDRTEHQVEVDHGYRAFIMKAFTQRDQPDGETYQDKPDLIIPGL